jgi:hypothetical protein
MRTAAAKLSTISEESPDSALPSAIRQSPSDRHSTARLIAATSAMSR